MAKQSQTKTADVKPEDAAIGRRVRVRMGTQGVSQRALAEHLGMSQPQLHYRIEGRISFRINEMRQIANYLETTVEKLTGS